MSSVQNVAREANDISRYQAHQIMRDFIEYKSHMTYGVQQFSNEDMELRVGMSQLTNDGNLMDKLFTFPKL